MKPILCLSIVLASFASADEAADKIALFSLPIFATTRTSQFVTADVAVVDAVGRRSDSSTPALLIMKRDGLAWRIAALQATYH